MSEEQEVAEVIEEEVVEEVVDPQDLQGEINALAASAGWKEDGEKTAFQYIVDGVEIQKKDRKTKEKLAKKVDTMSAGIEILKSNFEKSEKAKEKQWQSEMDDLREQMRKAVSEGDTETYDAVEKKRERLSEEKPDAEAVVVPPKKALAEAGVVFEENNPWYKENKFLRLQADRVMKDAQAYFEVGDETEYFEYVAETVKEMYPEKFEQRKRSPDGVSSTKRSTQSNGKGYKDLPPDAKADFMTMVDGEIYENSDADKREYADLWFSSTGVETEIEVQGW
jgi:hypothetical protein